MILFQYPGLVVANGSPPFWTVPVKVTSNDGNAVLSWSDPEGQAENFFRITETFNGKQTIHYVEETELRAWRVVPGEYGFAVQACKRIKDGSPDCGIPSNALKLEVAESVVSELQTGTGPVEDPVDASVSISGGPDLLQPGQWYNRAKDGHGWSFYWANRLALPENDPLFGNNYDLVGIWYTYEAKSAQITPGCGDCPPFTGNYSPVVLKLRAISTDVGRYSGNLTVSRGVDDVWVGSAEVIFGSDKTNATVNWNANFKKESLSDSDPLVFLHGSDPTNFDNISHYSGVWKNSSDDRYFVVTNIGQTAEVTTVVFHDDAGDPTWIQAVNVGTPESSSSDICLAYLTDGYSPDTDKPSSWVKDWHMSSCDSSLPADTTNRNGRRYFSGLSHEHFWADFTLPGTEFASGSISIGASNLPVVLEKTASFHGIGYDSATGETCVQPDGGQNCEVQLTWYTDGYYPEATVFAHELLSNLYHPVSTSTQAATIDFLYQLPGPGKFQFELRMGNSAQTTLMARSGSFTVTENVANAPPILMQPGGQTGYVGELVEMLLSASDPDESDTLSFSAQGLPSGLAIDQFSGRIRGTLLAPIGEHQVIVTVQDNFANSDSKTFVWNVLPQPGNPEQPPAPASPPSMTASNSSSRVGATVGEFRVDESGSATYNIPILTAPASGGLAPKISLNYSSQAGNGELGVGWSLGGVSVISRCPPTMEQDDTPGSRGIRLNGADRFCLDGQRLISDNSTGGYGGHGTQYRTEIDIFARVTSYGESGNGPAWFKVEHKNGSVVEYGRTADSRIEARGSHIPATVITWAQNRTQDRFGNYILYKYLENSSGPVAYALKTIEYTGNVRAGTSPSARLSFVYDERKPSQDLTFGFVAGAQFEQRLILRSIHSQGRLVAGSPLEDLRFYELSYDEDGVGRQILSSLKECRSAKREVCYPPTRFEWLKSESKIESSAMVLDGLLPRRTTTGLLLADVSGDGRPDLLYTHSKSKNHLLHIKESTPSGGFNDWDANYYLPKKSDSRSPRVFAIDINSDGFQDVVYSKYSKLTDNYTWAVLVSSGNTFLAEIELNSKHKFLLEGDRLESRIQVMDFNGDGLSDILHVHTSDQGNRWHLSVLLNTTAAGGNPSLAPPIELDVDNTDLFPLDEYGEWDLSGLPPYFNWEPMRGDNADIPDARIFDFNGDGAVDLLLNVRRDYQKCVQNCVLQADVNGGQGGNKNNPHDPVYEYSTASFWVLMESTGQNTYRRHSVVALGEDCTIQSVCALPEYAGLRYSAHVWPVDINADGLADLAWGERNSSWYFRLNSGNGFLAARHIGQVPDGVNKLVRFEDWNGDSYPDLIYPSETLDANANWMVHQNHFGTTFAAVFRTAALAGNVGGHENADPVENDASVFADFTGDGKTDQLLINKNKNGEIVSAHLSKGVNVSGSVEVEPANVITSITNGFGAVTEIAYRPLTDGNVYTRTYDSISADWGNGAPVYDYIAPLYVVSNVSQSAPVYGDPEARSSMEYHYVGAKLQAGGRGLLGFAEIIVYNPQLQIRINTRYRQDFPYVGLPVDTAKVVHASGSKFSPMTAISSREPTNWTTVTSGTKPPSTLRGILLSYSINHWREAPTIAVARQVYLDSSLIRRYTLSGNLESKVLTQNSFDNYGNTKQSIVSTFPDDGSGPFAKRTTVNNWSTAVLSNWTLGRLNNSTVTHVRSGKPSIARESAFTYDGTTGALAKEIIEPETASLRVDTTFSYDIFGNRKATSRKGTGMDARTSSVTHDALGRFVIRETNALGQVIRKINPSKWDNFGNPLEIENIDGVVSISAADLMGRAFASYNETGAWQKTLNYLGKGANCPAGTIWYSVSSIGGAASIQQCFDVNGRSIRKISTSINNRLIFADQYHDSSGRPSHISEPYFKNSSSYWNETAYDELGRITGILSAGGDDISTAYDEQASNACVQPGPRVIMTTNAMGQHTTEIKNVLGETIKSYDNNCGQVAFDYDSMGQLIRVTGEDGSVTSMSYDGAGRKIAQSDPDKGNWQYAYNSLGELIRQLDSKQQAIDFEYDPLGRVTHRRELTGVSGLNDSVFTIVNHEFTTYRLTSPGKSQPESMLYRQGESGPVIHEKAKVYDGLGRVSDVSTTIDGQKFYQQTTYDAYGRVFQQFDASGNDRGLRYVYKHGHLSQMKEARDGLSGEIYQELVETDARGNTTRARLGNGVIVIADYDPASGRLIGQSAYDQSGVELQNMDYLFDVLGNLKSRHDLSGNNDLKENFTYDGLNRLTEVQLTAPALGIRSPVETLALSYSATGNITWKSDVGAYAYGLGSAGPHAVSRAGNASYDYDANGNQLSGDGRSITYTVFDKAASLTAGNQNTKFTYGIGNSRVLRQDSISGVVKKTTLYLEGVEYITQADGQTLFKRYLGGAAVANFYPTTTIQQNSYLLKDHIGSIHTVLDEDALITTRMHFGPFGERRDSNWQTTLDSYLYAPLNDLTTRGFTGHEHVDSVGVIHMNGRIYDPKLGRFLQADPFVQAPQNTQSLNRYSYVFNNPLSYTDPSGYFSLSKFFKKWGRTIAAVAASIFLPGAGGILSMHFGISSAFAQYVITGFIAGGITDGIKGAVRGAFLAAVTYGVTRSFNQAPNGQVQLNEGSLAPTRENLEHMLGTSNPSAGLYEVEVRPWGDFESARSILSNRIGSGDTIFSNGMNNNFQEAVRNGTTQVAQLDGAASGYILNFNPTKSMLSDALEATGDIANTYFGFGQTELAENLAKVVDTASRNGVTGLRLIGHSQGAAITTSALRYAADTGLRTSAVGSVNLHGAPLNDLFIRNSLQKRTGVNADSLMIRAQFGDPVHNILGVNFISNPLRLPFSAIRIPQLFSRDATLSPHTVPCFGGRTAMCSG